jgi:hypothetical protein
MKPVEIREKLAAEIRVIIIWPGAKMKLGVQQKENVTKMSYPFSEVSKAIDALPSQLLGSQLTPYQRLMNAVKILDEKIYSHALEISTFLNMISHAPKLPSGYFEKASRFFEIEHEDNLIIEAPMGWLPGITG